MTKKTDIFDFTAADILSIPKNAPERLFTEFEEKSIKLTFSKLASKWHPDRCKDRWADDVMAHISHLRGEAEKRAGIVSAPEPPPAREQLLKAVDGKEYRVKFAKQRDFELGEMYIGTSIVTFAVKKDFADLFANAEKNIKAMPYADDKMKKEFSRYLPEIVKTFETVDRLYMVVKKDPEAILLADLQEHLSGKIEPVHAAWVLSSMLNTACYMRWAGMVHNDIALDTYFITPKGHSGHLLGGWWFSAKEGSPLSALPSRTHDIATADVLNSKRAMTETDIALIKAAGREMLGDASGFKLLKDTDIPKALSAWLTTGSKGDAYSEYKTWKSQVLPDSFGPPKYVDMKQSFHTIYKP